MLCDDLLFYDYTGEKTVSKRKISLFNLRKNKILLVNSIGTLYEIPNNFLLPWAWYHH